MTEAQSTWGAGVADGARDFDFVTVRLLLKMKGIEMRGMLEMTGARDFDFVTVRLLLKMKGIEMRGMLEMTGSSDRPSS